MIGKTTPERMQYKTLGWLARQRQSDAIFEGAQGQVAPVPSNITSTLRARLREAYPNRPRGNHVDLARERHVDSLFLEALQAGWTPSDIARACLTSTNSVYARVSRVKAEAAVRS